MSGITSEQLGEALEDKPTTPDLFRTCPRCGGTDFQRTDNRAFDDETFTIEIECENCGDNYQRVYEWSHHETEYE